MIQPGDMIIYGKSGVCRVEQITPMAFEGMEEALCYVLRPLYRDGLIYAPVTTRVFMRPILSKAEVLELVDEIPKTEPEVFHERSTQLLTQHYEGILSTHDCRELLRMTMALYRKQQTARADGRRFGQIDSRFMKRAEELLFGEMAAALGLTPEEIPGWIERRIGGKGSGGAKLEG